MHVTLFAGKSTTKYQKRLTKLGFTFDVLPAETDLSTTAATLYKTRAETTDVVQLLIEDWNERDTLLGRHYGRPFSSYRGCIVRYRPGWEKVAEHELLHAADAIIWTYTGVSLAHLFGVDDFDKIVHGEAPGYREYEYDDVWKVVLPHLKVAVAKRKRMAQRSAMERAVVRLKNMVAILRDKVEDIKGITHPVAGFPVSQPYGVRSKRYPKTGRHIGTDYATPIGTPVLAPRDGTVTKAGFSSDLGWFCHFEYVEKGELFTARFLHLKERVTVSKAEQGDVIGYTGNTGESDGPHIHIDIFKGDVRLSEINAQNWSELTVDPELHFA